MFDIQDIKEKCTEAVLIHLGADSAHLDGKHKIRCVIPAHDDKTPSMEYRPAKKTVKCYGCGFCGDVFALVGEIYHLSDFREQVKKVCDIAGYRLEERPQTWTAKKHIQDPERKESAKEKPEADYTTFFEECGGRYADSDYLVERGISDTVAHRYGVGYCESWVNPEGSYKKPSKRIIIPTGKGSYLARATDEKTPKQYQKIKVGDLHLFNAEAITRFDSLYVVEGEIDGLSLAQIGYDNFVALGGTSGANLFIEAITEASKTHPKAVYLALDNDPQGQKAQQKIITALRPCDNITIFEADICGDCKDPNEALNVDYDGFKQRAESPRRQALENHQRNTVKSCLDSFLASRGGVKYQSISTGFSGLDSALSGGLYKGLYILGAVSATGKTTLALQIADNIAKAGRDVLFFSMEMGKDELIGKSLSRLSYQRNGGQPLTYNQITRGTGDIFDDSTVNAVADEYRAYSGNLYVFEDRADVKAIGQTVAEHINITGESPVVFVDYLQIIKPSNERQTDIRLITDTNVTGLRQISRAWNVPVFAISSLNRLNYYSPVSLEAFKESGSIEYSADVLLGLQPAIEWKQGDTKTNIEAWKQQNPRPVEIPVLKNRYGGTGHKALFDFQAKYSTFTETATDDFDILG